MLKTCFRVTDMLRLNLFTALRLHDCEYVILGEHISVKEDTFVESTTVLDDSGCELAYVPLVYQQVWRIALAKDCVGFSHICVIDSSRTQSRKRYLVPKTAVNDRVRKMMVPDPFVDRFLLSAEEAHDTPWRGD